ncbi:hypothetical protein NQ314_002413 [Rhamnusium bicolor]|uniref:Uncharacterized protein n=1 Tax=Rhamnusium bicolor TaxID=1586634 RepID=A0AAV8ZQW5_9CUCU|nr:hypothetical protein NQ314_002413 [Rhamnusium bicolor]
MNSCCDTSVTTCTAVNAYQQGCVEALKDFLERSVKIIGIIAIVFAVVEVSIDKYFYLPNEVFPDQFHILVSQISP